jgi:hypothetical protein
MAETNPVLDASLSNYLSGVNQDNIDPGLIDSDDVLGLGEFDYIDYFDDMEEAP